MPRSDPVTPAPRRFAAVQDVPRPEAGPQERALSQARDVLAGAGFAEYERNEYGSTIRAGWMVGSTGDGGEVRVEHAMRRDLVGDPDRIGPDERYLTQLEHRDAYADAFTGAGWRVRTRTVLGNRSILLARPPAAG